MKILRFTASWCQPCKALAQNLERVTTDLPIQVIDIDEQQDLAVHFNVRSVPTLVKIDADKKEVARVVGVQNTAELESFINNVWTAWFGKQKRQKWRFLLTLGSE